VCVTSFSVHLERRKVGLLATAREEADESRKEETLPFRRCYASFPPRSVERTTTNAPPLRPLLERPSLSLKVILPRRPLPPHFPLLVHGSEPHFQNRRLLNDENKGGDQWLLKQDLEGGEAGEGVAGAGSLRGVGEEEAFDGEGREGGEGGEEVMEAGEGFL
jgi:hypothetical protein